MNDCNCVVCGNDTTKPWCGLELAKVTVEKQYVEKQYKKKKMEESFDRAFLWKDGALG